jgi:aspartyl-tRNA(Asn)/glutamyl-tRNA(Gln) amidotransferase subunit C
MALSLQDVHRIAYLARIEVNEAEATAVLQKLSSIFGMIEQLQKVDTTGVEPMSHAQDIPLRLREDVVSETDQSAQFQSIAPQTEGGLYLVPKVID